MKNPITDNMPKALHTILNSMNGGLIIIDEDSLIQFINPKSEELFGYQEGELEGKNISILMPEHHRFSNAINPPPPT